MSSVRYTLSKPHLLFGTAGGKMLLKVYERIRIRSCLAVN